MKVQLKLLGSVVEIQTFFVSSDLQLNKAKLWVFGSSGLFCLHLLLGSRAWSTFWSSCSVYDLLYLTDITKQKTFLCSIQVREIVAHTR